MTQDQQTVATTNDSGYVCRKQAAKFLDISTRTLDRLAGNDPTFPKGRRVTSRSRRWSLRELDAWMQSRDA